MILVSATAPRPTGLRRAILRGGVILTVAAAMTACGFQFRGKVDLPFERAYVDAPPFSVVAGQLKRGIEGGSRTRLTDNRAEAQAVIAILNEQEERAILAVSGGGRVRELQLRYRLSFRVHDGKGRAWLPPTDVNVARDMTYDESQILSKEGEAQMLFREMRSDAVQQVLRRIQAIRASSEVEE